MSSFCEDRVCIVTGGGRGIGRDEALSLGQHGAKVIVNDLGAETDGTGKASGPADEVVAEIKAAGGEAIANYENIADFDGAGRLVQQAIDTYGRLDVVVNNAGILRDRMLVNMTEAEWDAVIAVHLKGTFCTSRHAAAYWRDQSKAGTPVNARLINTTSVSGLYGNPGQTNYGAAKAGIALFTVTASMELKRYGVQVNCVGPGGLTRMTAGLSNASPEEQEKMNPRWVAPIVTWLASTDSDGITGKVFEATGSVLAIAEGWHRGPSAEPIEDPTKIGDVARDLVKRARKPHDMRGMDRDD